MTTFGQLKAGSLTLYNQTIEVADVSLGDLRFENVDTNAAMRLRTANNYHCVFDFSHVYDKEDELFEEKIVAGGSVSHSDKSYLVLSASAAGDKVIRQSYQYIPYCVGNNNFVMFGAMLSSSSPQSSGVRVRAGVYDDTADKTVDTSYGNGFFFQLQNNSLQVVKRTSTGTTSQEDTIVDQAYFSEDSLDGQGPSKYTFVPNKVHTFFIDLNWTGTGYVRVGVVYAGKLVCAHVFYCQDGDFPRYGSLPLRFEIANVSSLQSDSVKITGGCVWSEGPSFRVPRLYTTSNGTTGTSVASSRVPVLSLRLKTSANRVTAYLKEVSVYSSTEVMWEVFPSGVLTGASWENITSSSTKIEKDTSATSVSGLGDPIKIFYSQGRNVVSIGQNLRNCLRSNMAGESNTLVICCSKLGDAASALVSVEWEEVF